MRGSVARRLAWAFWSVGLAFSVLAVTFLILGRSTPPPAGTFGFRGFAATFFVTFGTVGALIASRHPSNPIGWIFLAMGVASGLQELAAQYAIYAVLTNPDAHLPLRELAPWIPSWIWVPGTSGSAYLLLLFPDGRLPSPRWRLVVWIELAGTLVATIGLALLPGPLENFAVLSNRFGVGQRSTMLAVSQAGQLVYGIGIILGAGALVRRLRRAGGEEREQLKWLASAGVFLAVTLFISFVTSSGGGGGDRAYYVVALLVIAGFSSFPIATGIAVLKYRLYDIDVVINKALVYGGLAAFITIVYAALVVGVGTAVGSRGEALLSAVAAAVVALAFQPVRRRAQRLANRLVYGKRATPYEVLSQFSDRLGDAYSVDDVLPRMARILADGTGAERVGVWLRVGPEIRRVASWPPDLPGPSLVGDPIHLPDRAFEVRHQGELLGAVTVAAPASEPMTPVQEKLVADAASQAGLMLRNVRLVEELKASRQRLVAAQDEERRRIERNLHDGAQQQLVALSVKARLAQTLAAGDPARAEQMLGELQAEISDTLDNLRDLARGIYPPLLADQGLAAALEAQARKSPVPVRVEADGVGRYPQEAEAAVYFCCLEALQNVAKYAGAARATVRITNGQGELRFEVADDGAGFDPAATGYGTGLQGMADRLAALGGELEIRSHPGGGTSVVGRLPTGVAER